MYTFTRPQQIVAIDLRARLTNLRKTETNIQKIMDRAGSISLCKLGIWLFVYSPYLIILAFAVYAFRRWRRNNPLLLNR